MEEKALTLFLFCKIFGLSYSPSSGKPKSSTHILHFFLVDYDDTGEGVKPRTLCEAITGARGQLNKHKAAIDLASEEANTLIQTLDTETLRYLYRMVMQKPAGGKEPYELLYEILPAVMSSDRRLHRESISYNEAFIQSFRNPQLRNRPFASDEAMANYLRSEDPDLVSPGEYCRVNGIQGFSDIGLPLRRLIEKLRDKTELYIVTTTGINLICGLAAVFLPEALANGTSLTVMLPNQYSSFANDVASIESPKSAAIAVEDFAAQFEKIISTLLRVVQQSKTIKGNGRRGKVYVGCTFTVLRQTVTMGVSDDREAWGWLSMTMPPARAIDGTPSFAFSGRTDTQNTASRVYRHVMELVDFAKSRNAFYELSEQTDLSTLHFGLEKESAQKYWEQLYQSAFNRTVLHSQYAANLIEVAAQHPLADGKPGAEFQARLDFACELYHSLCASGKKAHIYVPGSVHYPDSCSLSEAGTRYLIKSGIPEENLLGDDMNRKYKGEDGVYNSADECYVASRIFTDGQYGHLHVVCSPRQMLRKQLFYIAFGVLPYFHTVPCDMYAHDLIYELFEAVPDVIFRDHTWQDEHSLNGNRTRRERKPQA